MRTISSDHQKFVDEICQLQLRLLSLLDQMEEHRNELLSGTGAELALEIAAEFETVGRYKLNIAASSNGKVALAIRQGRNVARMYGLAL